MLRMQQAQFDAIREHGEAAYPHESCGVLLGHSTDGVNAVVDAVRAENTRADSAHNRYQIAPQELVRVQREARQQGLDIVGFYHSHPDHPARWSSTDFAEAHWLGCSYVITGIERGTAKETNSFLLTGLGEDDKKFENEEINVSSAGPVFVEMRK